MRSTLFRMLPGSILAASLLLTGTAHALEEWQIGHGGFVSASDVRNHNKMPLDIRDVNDALGTDEPDWRAALERFAFGEHFANHSLAIFTDNYNGRFPTHLPVSSLHFGDPSFQNHALSAALIGTGSFRRTEAAERVAFVEAALQSVVINWARYELGESQRKATMAEPNWSLENGSTKNWNEIFAFYWGPDGQFSAYAELDRLAGGAEINAALLQTLAEGQDVLLTETWTPEHAASVAQHLNEASLLLFRDALEAALAADGEEAGKARHRAAGYWLAAAEAVAQEPEKALLVEAALATDADADDMRAALAALPE